MKLDFDEVITIGIIQLIQAVVLQQCAHLGGESAKIHSPRHLLSSIKLESLGIGPKNVCLESPQVILVCLLEVRGQVYQSAHLASCCELYTLKKEELPMNYSFFFFAFTFVPKSNQLLIGLS